MDEIDRFEEDSHEAPVAGDGFVVDLDSRVHHPGAAPVYTPPCEPTH